jgi:DNA-directed RNA polymerase subunit RPC12/RpoP
MPEEIQQPPKTHPFQCSACGHKIEAKLPDPEDFTFVNTDKTSVIVLDHSEATVCPNCGLHYKTLIAGVAPNIQWAPFEDKKKKEESRIILPNMVFPPAFRKPDSR